MVSSFRTLIALFVAVAVTSSVDAGIKLKAVRFPAALNGTKGTKVAPLSAPLSQRVVFEFSGEPSLGPGIAQGLAIRVATGPFVGQIAHGTFKVSGTKVFFSPRLPTSPLPPAFGVTTNVSADAALPGLIPGTSYAINVTIGDPNAIANLTKVDKKVVLPLMFTTTSTPELFFANAKLAPVKVKKGKVAPKSGTKGIHPTPFADPAGLFSSIKKSKRPPFEVVFDGPLSTESVNFTRDRLRLRATRTPDGASIDEPLGAKVVLVENEPTRARVQVWPNGLLPLGHDIVLEVSNLLRALSGAVEADVGESESWAELAKYRVASDPVVGLAVDEFLEEGFDHAVGQDTSLAADGIALAAWDAQNSNVLRASFGFGGDESLGRFAPPTGEPVTVFLDTDFQPLPLFSGATPDAAPGTSVIGGVFHFSTFDLPADATIIARGSNPLIITATGKVTIRGRINLNGANGQSDNTFDSSMTTMPGGSPGAGGGKGGDGHPVTADENTTNVTFIQTPPFGGTGQGPGGVQGGGGGGGECGVTLPWAAFAGGNCANSGGTNGSRGPGGGGGSFGNFLPSAPELTMVSVSGRRGGVGLGNHVPIPFDPTKTPGSAGNPVSQPSQNMTFAEAHVAGLIYDSGTPFDLESNQAKTKKILRAGEPGPKVFGDPSDENDYIGPGGEISGVIGGQGGGAGGSRTEGLDLSCVGTIFTNGGLPLTVLDARGGGGGGGGGAILIQALDTIEFLGPNAVIEARGGNGGGGEQTELSDRGGAGGGGSGGAVLLQSAVGVVMNDASLPTVVIDVSGGCGANARTLLGNALGVPPGGDNTVLQVGDGGPGGPGIVQVQVPLGQVPQIDESRVNARIYPSVFVVNQVNGTINCGTGTGQSNFSPLVPPEKTPVPFSSRSVARSKWMDLGAAAGFRPPVVTSAGALQGPVFGVPGVGPFFKGTDPATGLVTTDSMGFVLEPFVSDIEVDAPDLARPDYIPNGSIDTDEQSVLVRFQGADGGAALSSVPNGSTVTDWVSDLTLLNGKRFIRWEIEFDIATDLGSPPKPGTSLPQVNRLRIPFKY